MEPARIDWNTVESIFVEEPIYENINAPKWIDFLNTHQDTIDDELWFCKPDCSHPKTYDDFLLSSSRTKDSNSTEKSEFSKVSLNTSPALKRRGKNSTFREENNENQNPNFATPPTFQALKETEKCCEERKARGSGDETVKKIRPTLKSTASTSNLFGGKSVLTHLTEFYSEVKKITVRSKEKKIEIDPEEMKFKTPLLKVSNRSEGSNGGQKNARSSPTIRFNPPVPQRISSALTPQKGSKSRLKIESPSLKEGKPQFTNVEEERGHLFWLFKPCAMN